MTDTTDKQLQLKQQLEALRQAYAQELPSKIAALKDEWQCIKSQPTEYATNELIRKTHNLRGSGATFGFPGISAAAHQLEEALHTVNTFMHSEHAFSGQPLDTLFAALDAAAHVTPAEETGIVQPLAKSKRIRQDCPRMLLVGDNAACAADMSAQLNNYGISTEVVESVRHLPARIEVADPDAILLDISASSDHHAELNAIEQIKRALFHPPMLIVVSGRDDMPSRLSAVRAGAAAYFPSPLRMTELVDFIRSQCRTSTEPAYRVLIVDDDARLAHHTALILQRAGMETSVVTEPMTVLESLSAFHPELILLDLYMPECSGLELAAVIRQQCAYTGTGIVFFSVETDINRHIDALREGGDEFFVKSMEPKRLVAAVEAKAKRARIIRRLMLRDGLTGLLNRASFDEYLQREFTKSKRQSHCFSYVMLDLDHFKRVNDQFGHQAGDEVLRALGMLLGQRLRAIDIAGRYGGEEIAIILPETKSVQAEGVIGELLEKFGAMKFSVHGYEFSATFSAGIAEYPCYPSLAALAEAVDQALYQAKAEGRNRVYVARGYFRNGN